MRKEYDTFVDDLPQLPAAGEVFLVVRELTPADRKKRYLTRYVRARVSNDTSGVPAGDVLWLRRHMGMLQPKPWSIEILENLGESLPTRERR